MTTTIKRYNLNFSLPCAMIGWTSNTHHLFIYLQPPTTTNADHRSQITRDNVFSMKITTYIFSTIVPIVRSSSLHNKKKQR